MALLISPFCRSPGPVQSIQHPAAAAAAVAAAVGAPPNDANSKAQISDLMAAMSGHLGNYTVSLHTVLPKLYSGAQRGDILSKTTQ